MLTDLLLHHPQSVLPLLRGTPASIWLLLAGLTALGLSQCRARSVGLPRSVALPLAMAALGGWGVFAAARSAPQPWLPQAVWLATVGATAALLHGWRPHPPAGTAYDAAARRFHLPGSATPLLLILAMFCLKYGVGLETALQPAHAQDTGFATAVAVLYGVGTGVFLFRALRLWRLARPTASRA